MVQNLPSHPYITQPHRIPPKWPNYTETSLSTSLRAKAWHLFFCTKLSCHVNEITEITCYVDEMIIFCSKYEPNIVFGVLLHTRTSVTHQALEHTLYRFIINSISVPLYTQHILSFHIILGPTVCIYNTFFLHAKHNVYTCCIFDTK